MGPLRWFDPVVEASQTKAVSTELDPTLCQQQGLVGLIIVDFLSVMSGRHSLTWETKCPGEWASLRYLWRVYSYGSVPSPSRSQDTLV